MASVNTKGTDTWQASVRVWVADKTDSSKGEWRRTWRTTGVPATAPKAEAEKVAEAIQAAALAVGPQNPRRADQRVFVEVVESIWRAAGVAPPPMSSTWRTFSREYFETADWSRKTRECYQSRLRIFTGWLGRKADDLLWNLTHDDFQAYFRFLMDGGRTHETARTHMVMLGSIMERAFLRGIIPRNPVKLVRSPAKSATATPKEDRESRQPFRPEEIAAILKVLENPDPYFRALLRTPLHTEWKTATLLGLCCGLRITDATRLRWADFDLEAGTVALIPEKKARKGRTIVLPLAAPLLRHLLAQDRAGEWVTPGLRGRRHNPQRFIDIVKLAGVDPGISHTPSKKDAGRPLRLKTFHSLRHTLLTMLAAAGTEKQLRMLISDHDDPRVNDRYTHGTVERLGAELAKVFPDVSGPAGGIQIPTAASPAADPL